MAHEIDILCALLFIYSAFIEQLTCARRVKGIQEKT